MDSGTLEQIIKEFNQNCTAPMAERVSKILLEEGLFYCPCGVVAQEITEAPDSNGVIIATKCACGNLDSTTHIKMTDLLKK